MPEQVLAVMQETPEILAVMRKYGFKGRPQGGGGRAGAAPRGGAGGGFRGGVGRTQREGPPMRDKRDMSCVNCGKKGHSAADCRGAKLERDKRPCFVC